MNDKKSGQEAVTEFFNKLPKEDKSPDADIFGTKPKEITPVVKTEEDDEDVDDSVKNRRHRRLEAKLQAEREANIALSERVKVLSEVEKFSKETPEVDPDIAKMFDASEIGKQNALRLSRKLNEIQEKAEEHALQRIESLKEEESKAIELEGNHIDSELERLEELYGIDLTVGKKQTTEFLQFVEDISPKDREGNLKDYADFESAWLTFSKLHAKEKPDNSRQREIASRSMQRSQSNAPAPKVASPGWDGWKKDLGIE